MLWFSVLYVILGVAAIMQFDGISKLERKCTHENLVPLTNKAKKGVVCIYLLYFMQIASVALLWVDMTKSLSVGYDSIFGDNWGLGAEISLFLGSILVLVWTRFLFVSKISFRGVTSRFNFSLHKKDELFRKMEEDIRQVKEQEAKTERENERLIMVYGKPDKIFFDPVCTNSYSAAVVYFPERNVVLFSGKEVSVSDLLNVVISDNSENIVTTTGTTESDSKVKAGSLVGRSLAGAAIAGPAGAVIGGATAKRTEQGSVTSTSRTTTRHHYVVTVYVANLSSSVISVDCGSNEKRAQELYGYLNALLHGARDNDSNVDTLLKDEVLAKALELKKEGYFMQAVELIVQEKNISFDEAVKRANEL